MGLDGYCQNEFVLYIIAIFKFAIKVLQIVTPIMAIVLISFSLYHYISNPEKGKSKVVTRFKNGLISVLVIFLIPTLINYVIHSFSNGAYVTYCWDEASTEVNFKGSFLETEEFDFDENSVSGTLNTDDLNGTSNGNQQNGEKINNSSYSANVTGDTKKLLEVAEEVWLSVVHGGYKYKAGRNQVPSTPPNIDCSTYVSPVLYKFGYTDFAGLQHHSKEFMQTNWNTKYGWTEIPLAAGEDATSKLKPGDILVRTNPGGYGHVNFIVSVENGVVRAYDCGSAKYWRTEDPIVVGNFVRSSRPGKIIRVT